MAINLCKGGEVLKNRRFTQLSDEWLKARQLPLTGDELVTDSVSKGLAVSVLK